MVPRKRRRSFVRRGVYALGAIVIVVAGGTVGLHYIEGMSFLDAFYFTSMVATAQGPSTAPVTPLGKVFVALLAFVSVGTVISALVFVFGPFFGRLVREGMEKVEEDARRLEGAARRDLGRKDDLRDTERDSGDTSPTSSK